MFLCNFKKLDSNLSFNVEIKYPFEFESIQHCLSMCDLNLYVDSILTQIFKLAKNRKVYISSFNPECCIAARHKQVLTFEFEF